MKPSQKVLFETPLLVSAQISKETIQIPDSIFLNVLDLRLSNLFRYDEI